MRRIRRNADAGDRRLGQRKERVCGASGCAERFAALLCGDHARLGCGERKARGAPPGHAPLECPIGLDRLILPARGTVLLEDMGNLVANELYDADGAGWDAVEAAVRGVERLHRQCAHLIVVSNEVFRGGADYAGDTARYLLALARVNNAVAARADHVCRVVCGLPRWVKGGDEFGCA